MPPQAFRMDPKPLADDTFRLDLFGDLNVYHSPEFRDTLRTRLQEETPKHVVLCLDGLDYIDSTGLGVLLGAYRRCDERQVRLSLVLDPRHRIRRSLELTGLSRIFALYPRVEDALAPSASPELVTA